MSTGYGQKEWEAELAAMKIGHPEVAKRMEATGLDAASACQELAATAAMDDDSPWCPEDGLGPTY